MFFIELFSLNESHYCVSTFPSLFLHFTAEQDSVPAPFLQVTGLVVLLPSFYSYRQIFRRTISHPDPIGATATHDTDLEFILKCLSHRPPFQYARGEVETARGRTARREGAARRSTAVQINECTIGG